MRLSPLLHFPLPLFYVKMLSFRKILVLFLFGFVLVSGCLQEPREIQRKGNSKYVLLNIEKSVPEGSAVEDSTGDSVKTRTLSRSAMKRDASPSRSRSPRPTGPVRPVSKPSPPPTADPGVVETVIARIDQFGLNNSYKLSPSGALIELSISTGELTLDDVREIAKLSDLVKLTFNGCRDFDDEYTRELLPLKDQLTYLQIGNSKITNDSGEILGQFVNLVELDLHHNANVSDGICRQLLGLEKLEKLNMIYTNLTQTGLVQIRKLPVLHTLDIRGCTIIADAGMKNVARIPHLKNFQHYSGSVTDAGLEDLTAAEGMESLFLQDFRLTDRAGQSLRKFANLKSLILFRCGEFGSKGLLELKGMGLNRLTLRGLPNVGNDGFAVFQDLPELKKLYITEMNAISDEGIAYLSSLGQLETLEIEIVGISDESLKTLGEMKSLKELKIRETNISNEGLKYLQALPNLKTLRILDNLRVDEPAAREMFAGKGLGVLEVKKTRGALEE